MKKIFLWLTLAVLALLNLTLVFRYKTYQDNYIKYLHHVEKSETYLEIGLTNNILLDNSPVIIDDLEKPSLCYVLSNLHCNQCVDSIIASIQNFQKKNEAFEYTILAKYYSLQDINLFKRLNKINSRLIQVSHLDYPILNSEVPVLFIYYPSSKTAHHIFTPDPGKPERTVEYLKLVNENILIQ